MTRGNNLLSIVWIECLINSSYTCYNYSTYPSHHSLSSVLRLSKKLFLYYYYIITYYCYSNCCTIDAAAVSFFKPSFCTLIAETHIIYDRNTVAGIAKVSVGLWLKSSRPRDHEQHSQQLSNMQLDQVDAPPGVVWLPQEERSWAGIRVMLQLGHEAAPG